MSGLREEKFDYALKEVWDHLKGIRSLDACRITEICRDRQALLAIVRIWTRRERTRALSAPTLLLTDSSIIQWRSAKPQRCLVPFGRSIKRTCAIHAIPNRPRCSNGTRNST